MTALVATALFTVFVWWFSTGAILWLDGRPARTYRTSFGVATLLLVPTLVVLVTSSEIRTAASAASAFLASLMVWAWIEMSFLMGFVTGPRRSRCPPGARGWRRARYALETILHHELLLLTGAALIAGLTHGADNRTALHAYLILWLLRTSAKLNVFLGVRNLSESFLPAHLAHLESYFRRRPMNLLFPFSVLLATTVASVLWRLAIAAEPGSYEAVSLGFLATLLSLAVLEHGFLVMPIPADGLWKWGLASRGSAPPAPPAAVAAAAAAATPPGHGPA